MGTLGLITARAGSRGLPNKHLLDLGGRPVIAWTVEAALRSARLERVVVSTDGERIAKVCRELGADVPFLRPSELARDDSEHVDVILHALDWLRHHQGYEPDSVMLLQPTSPFRDAADIDGAIAFRLARGAESLISVSAASMHPYFSYRLDENSTLTPYLGDRARDLRRQELPVAWHADGAMFLLSAVALRSRRTCFPDGSIGYRMPEGHGIQIDTQTDLDEARRWHEQTVQHRTAPASPELVIAGRRIGPAHPPLVVAEVGINHEGSVEKAHGMIDDAADAGCECVKFQCHVIEDEMVPAARLTIPANAAESIWDIMSRCALDEAAERELLEHAASRGLIYLSTPFSRAAADRLSLLNVPAFKIGSGECSNLPLVRHIAGYGRPVLLSTGMHGMDAIREAVEVLREAGVPFALLHCTSLYPTPYDRVRLGALQQLADAFPDAVIGFSDHSLGNWCSLAAVALGASVIERHFVSDRRWPGPDVPLSMDPADLADLVAGVRAIHAAKGGQKTVLPEEQPTRDFALASVVSTRPIAAGEPFSRANVWVKRPGTGAIPAARYDEVLGRHAARDIPADAQLDWIDVA